MSGQDGLSVLPTERLVDIIDGFKRYADALIEIAAGFDGSLHDDGDPDLVDCFWCDFSMASGCGDWCPGLRARRALGVA